jgi:hypothetical protein
MGKIIDCHKVNPTKEHGLAPTPELLAQAKSLIEDE